MIRRGAAAGLLALAFALPLRAEIIPPDPSIGRVNHAGYNRHSHCTGFQLAGGHLITAAHCLPNAERSVHYLAGFDRGQFQRHIEEPKSRFRQLRGRDIATTCVADRNAGLPLYGGPLSPGQTVTVRGYAAPRSQVLQVKRCAIIRASRNAVEIGCPLSPGNSGGPVTIEVARRDAVIGVVSATNLHAGIIHRIVPGELPACR